MFVEKEIRRFFHSLQFIKNLAGNKFCIPAGNPEP